MNAAAVLARIEGARLIRNPALWLSLLLTVEWFRNANKPGHAEDALHLLVGYGLAIPGFVLFVATVLAVLRGRLEHTEELLMTAPVDNARRSIAHAMASVAGGLVGVLVITAIAIALPIHDPLGPWSAMDNVAEIDIPAPNIAHLLQGPAAVMVMITMALAIARWIPTWLVVIPFALLLGIQVTFLGIFHSEAANGGRWLIPLNTGVVNGVWQGCGPDDATCTIEIIGFDQTTPWWHLLYLLALCVWLTTIAVLRHRRDRVAWTWFACSGLAVLATAVVQVVTAESFS